MRYPAALAQTATRPSSSNRLFMVLFFPLPKGERRPPASVRDDYEQGVSQDRTKYGVGAPPGPVGRLARHLRSIAWAEGSC